jgi:S1-C subfamily serine protease
LILTIGYLVLEATQIEVSTADGKVVKATIVGSDYDTGFGLLRASESLGVTPLQLGQSSEVSERQQVLVVTEGRSEAVQAAFVTSRREFVGYWEYLLEDAIFTAPPSPRFAGAALIGAQGQLLGVGSLFVNDALPDERVFPGNMFVPIDRLKPVLDDLIAKGRPAAPPRPWLGVFTEEYHGHLFVSAVIPEGPAEKAGLKPGDLIAGIGGKAVNGRASFYRAVWAQGTAGVEISLDILQGLEIRKVAVRSVNRDQYFQTPPGRPAPGDKRQTNADSLTTAFRTVHASTSSARTVFPSAALPRSP